MGRLGGNYKRRDKLLKGERLEGKKKDLQSMLPAIARHVASLIRAAEDRAEAGDSLTPTARGDPGWISTTETATTTPIVSMTKPSLFLTTNSQGKEALQSFQLGSGRARGITWKAPESMGKFAADEHFDSAPTATINASTTTMPARTRVLRRMNSIRNFFLCASRKKGEQLTQFAQQMGLPLATVVAFFEVRTSTVKSPPALPGIAPIARFSPSKVALFVWMAGCDR